MGTLYNDIAAARMAEGALYTPNLGLDSLGNDWSLLSGPLDISLPPDTVNASSTPSWVNLQTFWVELPPAFTLDNTYDDLEVVLSINLECKIDNPLPSIPVVQIRLVGSGGTGAGVVVNTTSYSKTATPLELLFALGSEPSGRFAVTIQGTWSLDPGGGEQLFVKNQRDEPDSDFYVRQI